MVNIGSYDPNQHDPRMGLDPLPAGWYAMQIVDSEICKTKAGTGSYLKLELEIVEAYHPTHKGRKVFENLNLWNANKQAVEIANNTLAAICKATGVNGRAENFNTDVLHRKPLAVKLKREKGNDEYEESNRVTGYDALGARFGPGAAAAGIPGSPPRSAAMPPRLAAMPPPQASQAPPAQPAPAPAAAPPMQGQPGQAEAPPWEGQG